MAIGERIGFFRKKRGMTQKYLGQKIGFPERSADVRMAQYEVGSRKPKEDVTNALAEALDVSPRALNVPDIDSLLGVAHTLFALEDIYGLAIAKEDGSYCLEPNIFKSPRASEIQTFMKAWYEMEAKRKTGEITQEEYDAVLSYLYLLELDNGYTQDFSAATAEYIPDFDLEGL